MFGLNEKQKIVDKISSVAKISLFFAISIIIIIVSINDYFTKINNAIESSKIIAEVIAKQSVASLMFYDRNRGFEIIESFGDFYNVNRITLYNKDFKIFAKYKKKSDSSDELFCKNKKSKQIKFFDKIIICKNIKFKDSFLGNVEVEYSLLPFYRLILKNFLFIILIGLLSYVFIYFYTIKLQKTTLNPLIKLTEAMKNFSSNRSFGDEIKKFSDDEIGMLIDTFNDMVKKIKRNEQTLKQYSENLEKLVLQRTKELLAAKEKAEESNRIKSDFIANISHEIKTPLNAIIGFTEIIEKKEKDDQIRELISHISSSSYILIDLINDILDFSKLENNKIKIINRKNNLNDILENLYNIFKIKAQEKELDFIVNVGKDVPMNIYIDKKRLMQILINILGNAFKFTEKGFVKLNITAKKKDKNLYDLSFIVEDTGCGIDEDKKETIFEPFQTCNYRNGNIDGTGLGLNICKNLVSLMNGVIEVDNRDSGGAIFTVTLFNVQSSVSDENFKIKEDFKIEFKEKKLFDNIESSQLQEFKNILANYNKVINIKLLMKDVKEFLKNNNLDKDLKNLCEKILKACESYDFSELEKIMKLVENHC